MYLYNYSILKLDRHLEFNLPPGYAAFLWGPRQTGKSTYLRQYLADSPYIDLLHSDLYVALNTHPTRLLDFVPQNKLYDKYTPIIIDEIQRIPNLRNEVHRLIETENLSFVLCGLSARKLVRGRANLLGGRALRYQLYPLTYNEIPNFDLLRALNHGLLPRHYLSDHARNLLNSYVNDYLCQEVFAEGLVRNVPAISRFFENLAYCHGELINYQNVARDTGNPALSVKEYFQIMDDTQMGTMLRPFSIRRKRDVITRTPKFFLFDVRVANHVVGRKIMADRGVDFGRALEHFILMELQAYLSYREINQPIKFWRTRSKLECDFVVGRSGQSVIEVKGSKRVRSQDLRGLRAFVEGYSPRNAFLVCNHHLPQTTAEGIRIFFWREFLDRLWADEFDLS